MEAQTPVEACLLPWDATSILWATPNASTLQTLARSCLKPFQALVLMQALTQANQSLTSIPTEAFAISCGSHSGQPPQVQWVEWLLNQANHTENHLGCGHHLPIDSATANSLVKADHPPCALHHNCSGNHAGLLWACHLQGISSEGYTAVQHPIQQQILTHLKALLPQKTEWLMAADGCTLPSYAFTLVELAQLAGSFANLPHGDFLLDAMARHPQLVAGSNRFDTVLMEACLQAGVEVVSKGGAEGLVVLWHKPLKQVAVLKTVSGDGVLRDFSIMRLLRLWGWLDGVPPVVPFELDSLPTPYATIPNTFGWVMER
ncbi:MAG: asparaginase [Candidatus Melainabacteria bacterium]|nr:asparaginase [Candidatus Melainabacteria bacterium]